MVAGKWNVALKTPMAALEVVFDLAEENGVLTGNLCDSNGASPISNGTVNGDEFSFDVNMKTPIGAMDITVTGAVDGDAISGKAKMKMGSMNFTGTRA